MQEKDDIIIKRITAEIDKLSKRDQPHVFFFVMDTKGNPNSNLKYIYTLALILKHNGYNVAMLYQSKEEFVGVGEWLGDECANIPHYDIDKGEVSVSASDILFIPELFSNIMIHTKNLPCKRIAILQNFDFMLEQMPMASQWGDLGILEAIVNTDLNGRKIKNVFPYVKTTTIQPYIDKMFSPQEEPQQMIINIIAKDQRNINKIIKPFYWKYPQYKWVSFRDVRGFSQEAYAEMLRSGAITIWIGDDNSFGYAPLEAMNSGSLVVSKLPNEPQKWMLDNKTGELSNCCVWFNSYEDVPKLLAMIVKSWIENKLPLEVSECAQQVTKDFNIETTEKQIVEYVNGVFNTRREQLEAIIKQMQDKKN